MARRIWLVAITAFLAGCGYVGDPLPPALNIPQKVNDLVVVQHGDEIVVEFTAPALTTESLAIRSLDAVDLRIGRIPQQFSLPAWEGGARQIPVDGEPARKVRVEIPAAEWVRTEVLVGVRAAARPGRFSEWTTVVAPIQPPLATPTAVRADPHPEGVRVSWTPGAPGTAYRVYRDGTEAGVVQGAEFIDKATALGKTYSYTVQAVRDKAQSQMSAAVAITAADRFAPAVPSAVTAVTGVSSIELAWERNTEGDLGSYRIYRAESQGEFTVLASAVEAPAYSDRQVTSGTTYRYAVTAVDKFGNESARSAPVQATAP